ncbi:hypothetical protein KUCAC02_017936 [Chaenocephalus aceratus]|uniref:Uncharacterized protein n=1 Tax=Chaenocephalus aceratus TaxID=36190 RepID=A0ACB9W7N3_CHAAC|nr:hypothetical protein KUCAC02_017936 [Chaenocephalus aceratus]
MSFSFGISAGALKVALCLYKDSNDGTFVLLL